jgi:hypothetical protein
MSLMPPEEGDDTISKIKFDFYFWYFCVEICIPQVTLEIVKSQE